MGPPSNGGTISAVSQDAMPSEWPNVFEGIGEWKTACIESVQQGEKRESLEPATQRQALCLKSAVSAQNIAGVNLHAIALP